MKKPDYYTLEIKQALNELRKANLINMFLAGSFLRTEFNLTETQADECVLYWIEAQCENLEKDIKIIGSPEYVKITT